MYRSDPARPISTEAKVAIFSATVASLSMLVALIGTSSTILLGWRAERRQSAEYKLKIEQLELQIAEARKKAAIRLDQISN
jgi:hypothetical protein